MATPTVVLVHGAFADAASWSGVIAELQSSGIPVIAPPNPLRGLAADAACVTDHVRSVEGPVMLVAHSYGGAVVSNVDPDAGEIVGLVYVAAFALDEGESLGALLGGGPPTPALANMIVDEQGFGWLPEDDFVGHFAADLDPVKARVMYAVQQGLSMSTFDDVMGEPAWKSQPTWYLVAQNDEAIPPDAERQFASRMGATTVEVPASHVAMVSRPAEVTELIVRAAKSVAVPA
jgi:pimeloyl-ACP methyl ester carboxylesterase